MALSIDAHAVQRFDVAIVSNYSCQMEKNQMKKERRFVIEAFKIYFGGRVNRKHNQSQVTQLQSDNVLYAIKLYNIWIR